MRRVRHVAPALSDDGWQITDADGQHTARITGTVTDAVARARQQLATVYGGGQVLVTDSD